MRAKLKKRQQRRNLTILAVAVVVIAVVVVAAYYLSTLNGSGSPLNGQPVTSAVFSPLYNIAVNSNYGPTNAALVSVRTSSNPSGDVQTVSGQPFTSGGKPILLYVGAEYCPLCGFQRWPLIMALVRFGNFSNLHYMQSSSTDSDPNTSTFTFLGSSYTSNYIVFQPFEQVDRYYAALQTVPSNYSTIFTKYGGGYPFLDFNNKYAVEGAFYDPTLFAGLNWTQIIQQIGNPNTQIGNEVMSSANAITALICNMTGGKPSNVCSNSSITSLSTTLDSFRLNPSTTLMVGTSDAAPDLRVGVASPQRRAVTL